MPAATQNGAWDFTPVYNLIQSLSQNDETPLVRRHNLSEAAPGEAEDTTNEYLSGLFDGLGDFHKVWDYLGIQPNVQPSAIPPFESSATTKAHEGDAYVSDGALYYPPSSKEFTWVDQVDTTDAAETQEEGRKLTKSQRKKANRKARKRAATADSAVSDLEDYPKSKHPQTKSNSPVTSSKDHHGYDLRPRDSICKAAVGVDSFIKPSEMTSSPIHPSDKKTSSLSNSAKGAELGMRTNLALSNAELAVPLTPKPSKGKLAGVALNSSLRPSQVTPIHNSVHTHAPTGNKQDVTFGPPPSTHFFKQDETTKLAITSVQDSLKKQWPVAKQFHEHLNSLPLEILESASYKRYHEILPLNGTTAVDRNWSLLQKLLRDYPDDKKWLVSPLQLSYNRPVTNGIHVFVDASNILIGFHEHLKRVRGLPAHARIARVDLAFHSLALLLERRRPVAKRVLAGSTPEIPAFEQARQVGYETNILDKVLKAKELTERQKKYMHASHRSSRNTGQSSASDGETGSGALTATNTPPKWVEQAVDEILHLKILESIVDVATARNTQYAAAFSASGSTLAKPFLSGDSDAPTMVLATGDAAEAEYSEGFMKQVERALKSGWNVEVVAWGASISQVYRKWQKTGKKGFKVIELDGYVEELFGTVD